MIEGIGRQAGAILRAEVGLEQFGDAGLLHAIVIVWGRGEMYQRASSRLSLAEEKQLAEESRTANLIHRSYRSNHGGALRRGQPRAAVPTCLFFSLQPSFFFPLSSALFLFARVLH